MRQTAIRAAKKAGKLLMKHYGKAIPGVRQKEKGSLVTDIDIRCNDLIIREIKRKFPAHSIITEESSPIDNDSPYTWHIDPIDGTHNYIRGLPLFGVSVAAAKNGKVVMGVICLPAFGKLYAAERGKGAFCNGRRIRVSPRRAIDYSFILFDSSASMRRKKLAFMHRIAGRMFNERVLGCAVYAAAMVAEGKSDAFVCFRTNSWDIAAGFLLIQEAGGRITSFRGEPWALDQGNYVAAAPAVQGKLLPLVKPFA